MRRYNPVFATYNAAEVTQRAVIIEICFDDISDVVYVTSHPNVDLPDGAIAIHGVITHSPVTSQQLQPLDNHSTNGDAQYTILDKNGEFTQLLREKNAVGKSVYKKTIVMRASFVGMPFEYTEVIATHQIERMSHSGLSYTLRCYDIQRFAQKENIFDPVKTLLTGNVAPSATTFPAQNTSKFEMVFHGPSHSTEPNMTVGYFKLKKNDQIEIVAYTGKTNAEFNGCIRGRFGTVPIQWDGLDSEGESNEIEITEVVYFELPVVKAIYAILTNALYADTGAHWPSHWSANVDERWVNTTSFVNIGIDIWDINNDDAGKICRFFMPEKESAKTFLYKELLPMIGCRFIIDKFGQIELRKITEILSTAPHVAELNSIGVIKIDEVEYDHNDILNFIRIDWSYDPIRESFLRTSAFADKPSIAKYKATKKKTIELHGMHGSRHNRDFIRHLFYVMRDQFGEEPIRTSVKVHPSYNALEVGDIVRLNMSHREDYTSESNLNRSFEVHSVSCDWLRNPFPQFKLVGSSRKTQIDMNDDPDSDDMYNIGYAIDESIYTLGTDIEVAFPSAVTRVGSQVTLISDIEITGSSQLTISGELNPACVFRVNGDFQINNGVKITGNRNIALIVNGFMLVNGSIESISRGGRGGDYRRTYVNQIGTVSQMGSWLNIWEGSSKIYLSNYNNAYQHAEPGFIHGSLTGQFALAVQPNYTSQITSVGSAHVDGLYEYTTDFSTTPWTTTETYISGDPVRRNVFNAPLYGGSLPTFEIDKLIHGLPTTLEGGGGPAGGHIYRQDANGVFDIVALIPVAHGSNGGNGGGGLVTITKGMDFGVNGYINTSGGASAADCGTYTSRGETFVAGRGAGGSPGCWLCIIDGADSTPPIINQSKFIAEYGESTTIGNPNIYTASMPIRYFQSDLPPLISPSNGQRGISGNNHASATVPGTQSLQGINFWDSFHKVIFVANQDLIVSDPETIDEYAPDALNVVLNEELNSPPTPAGNRSSIEVYAQPPSPLLNYSHSIIEWKYAADSAWNRLNIVAQDEMVFDLPSNGAIIDVRALAVSTSGRVSPSGPSSSITLTNIGAGQYVLDFGFDPDDGSFWKVIDTLDGDSVVGSLSGSGGYTGKVVIGSDSSGYANITDRPTTLAQINATEGTKLAGIANGATQNHVYRQASAPASGMVAGDLWFDTDDSNRIYRYSGSAWQDTRDAGISAALATAQDALDTADGKIDSYFQATAPASGMSVGDLWFDSDDGYKQYRYSGSAWQVVQDSAIADAIQAASDAQSTADGKAVTFYASSNPTAEGVGDLWYHTTTGVVRRWSGASWDLFSTYNDLTALNTGQDDLIFNSRGLVKAADGRPAGIYAAYGSVEPTIVSYLSEALGHIRLYSASDNTIGMAYPAFRLEANTKYRIRISYKSNAASASGLYFRIAEYDTSVMPDGITHIAAPSTTNEAGKFVTGDRQITSLLENAAVTTSWVTQEYVYTPTSTAKWASPIFLNWTGMGFTELHVRLVSAVAVVNSNATQNTIFRQAAAPSTGMVQGDLWLDTDDNNRLYWYNGSSWLDSRDVGITQALTNAATAQSTADGKIKSYYQTTAPVSGMVVGDLWFDTDDGNRVYRYSGSAWVTAQDSAIAAALNAASDAQATADGKVTTFFTTSTPTAESIGDLWYNTTTKITRRWSGSVWEDFSSLGANWSQVYDDNGNAPSDNADVTQTVIDADLVTTGGLVLDTGGAVRTTGKTDIDDGVEGVFLGDVAGDKTFYVGDGVDDFISYKEGVGLTIGKNVNIEGLASTFNDDISIMTYKNYLHDFELTQTNGTAVFASNGIMVLTGSGTTSYKVLSKYSIPGSVALTDFSFANPFALKFAVRKNSFMSDTNAMFEVGVGNVNDNNTSSSAGFVAIRFANDGIYLRSALGGGFPGPAPVVTLLTSTPLSNGVNTIIVLEYDPSGAGTCKVRINSTDYSVNIGQVEALSLSILMTVMLSSYGLSPSNSTPAVFNIGDWRFWMKGS